jgi:Putative zinc-finger
MRAHDEHPRDDQLVSASDGELRPDEQARLESHLQRCAECRARLATIASTLKGTEELHLRAESIERAAGACASGEGDGRARLAHALREGSTRRGASRTPSRFAAGAALPPWSLAAAVLLLGVSVWALGSRTPFDRGPAIADESADAGTPASMALPLRAATPGAVSAHSAMELCAGARPSRMVSDETRRAVLRTYGMEQVPADQYELDALITPELGGTTEAGNLWPQRYGSPVWNARVKDELERLLPELVCGGEVALAHAQQAIATDWIAAYKQFFNTTAPLQTHRGQAIEDEELVLLPARLMPATTLRASR